MFSMTSAIKIVTSNVLTVTDDVYFLSNIFSRLLWSFQSLTRVSTFYLLGFWTVNYCSWSINVHGFRRFPLYTSLTHKQIKKWCILSHLIKQTSYQRNEKKSEQAHIPHAPTLLENAVHYERKCWSIRWKIIIEYRL